MGNVCATRRGVFDRFPTDDEVNEFNSDVLDSDVFDDIMFRDYMEGKHEFVENMVTRGSSFLNKTGKEQELHVEIPSPTDFRMPPLSTRKSSDHSFFGEHSQHDVGFRIQNPRPMPLCFTGPRTPPGSPPCFDSDCKSQFSDSDTPPSSDFESSFQSTPPQSQPRTPAKQSRNTFDSMSSDEDKKGQGFDKSIWIWPSSPPRLKLKELGTRDMVWPPSPRNPQFTPLVCKKNNPKRT